MQMKSLISCFASALMLCSGFAFGAPVLIQTAGIDIPAGSSNNLVTGATTSSGASGKADAADLYWYDTGTKSVVSSLGGGASVVVNSVKTLRANANADPLRLAKMALGGNTLKNSDWSVDLGADLLKSNVTNHAVTGSVISVLDFGNENFGMWFDFRVGLWNGRDLVLAGAMDQLVFDIVPATGTSGGIGSAVSYLGGNLFRFMEASSVGSGTSLHLRSALDDYEVRSLAVTDVGVENDQMVRGDFVDLYASRTLESTLTDSLAVPEPPALLLFALGLAAMLGVRARRSSARV